jgi:hypothetical protein
MTQTNKSFLIRITIVLLVGILYGCSTYGNRVITSNEASAILGLKMIHEQEAIKHNNTKKYVPLDQLYSQADAILSPSQLSPGYRFDVRLKEGGKSFEGLANPTKYNETGRRSFYMDEQGVIHGADKGGGEATGTDPEVK